MSQKNVFILALAGVLLAVMLSGCASPSPVVKTGDNVTIDYIVNASNGTLLQTSYEQVARDLGAYEADYEYSPYSFTVGSPSILQGVNEAIIGMKVNETKTVTVPPEKAYGLYNRSLIIPYNLSELTAANITPIVNRTLLTPFGQLARIDAIDAENNTVYLDFNRAYAGQTLVYQITVRKIE